MWWDEWCDKIILKWSGRLLGNCVYVVCVWILGWNNNVLFWIISVVSLIKYVECGLFGWLIMKEWRLVFGNFVGY